MGRIQNASCIHDERDISNGALLTHEPLLLRENALEHTENSEDLFLIALDDLWEVRRRVDAFEPTSLTKVGPILP